MTAAKLEHINITVTDVDATAQRLCELFGWKIRWKGDAIAGGTTIHVGSDTDYIAVYTSGTAPSNQDSHSQAGAMNHIGVVVSDLNVTEIQIKDMGFTTYSHGDYEPGRRFYFRDPDGIEFEVVSYQ